MMRCLDSGRLVILLLCGSGLLLLPLYSSAQQQQAPPRPMYFGAPPTIPHEAGPEMNECLTCHGEKDSGAPLTPHPTRARCRQCHVAANAKAGEFRRNNFSGLTTPAQAQRWDPKAPPMFPHPVLLHENCLACHAPGARKDVVSTTHPQRVRCQQCHIPVSTGNTAVNNNGATK